MNIFITGLAGMIGFHTAKKLVSSGHTVTGVDNFNDYYEVSLKRERERILKDEYGITVADDDIRTVDYDCALKKVDVVLHLAAYANPRHALAEPQLYIDTNITGTQRLIEGVERMGIKSVVYASSSCVMHGQPLPWNEHDLPGYQNNPYGWSKRANECQFMHSNIAKHVGLRFFTVYGPYGRPDMALFGFTKKILENETIDLYNYGDMKRDFTFVEDIVQGIDLVIGDTHRQIDPVAEIYNIGFGESVNLMDFLHHIENQLGKKAVTNLLPKHPADVPATWSDTTKIQRLGYNPTTNIASGVEKFVTWYKDYYKV
jgi:UDP-glucuronate 4-epimerase